MVWGNPNVGAKNGSASLTTSKTGLVNIMNEQLVEQLSCSPPKQQQERPEMLQEESTMTAAQREQYELELALKLSMEESARKQDGTEQQEVSKVEEEVDIDTDLALALQLQEEEQNAFEQFKHQKSFGSEKVSVRSRFMTPEELARKRHSEFLADSSKLYSADDAEELFEEATAIRAALLLEKQREMEEEQNTKSGGKDRRPAHWRNKNLKGQGGEEEIITRHDTKISAADNWDRMEKNMMFTTKTGDVIKGKKGLSNKVYNSLKHDLRKQRHVTKGFGSSKVDQEITQTKAGLDEKTRLLLHKLVNTGLLEQVNGAVRTGKEAIVFHATGYYSNEEAQVELEEESGDDDDHEVEEEGESSQPKNESITKEDDGAVVVVTSFAIKVFKTTLTQFKNRLDYVRGDYRFASIDQLSHQNPRKVVNMWAEKEMRNLVRLQNAKIPSPYPVRLVSNVLLMEFIGEDGWAAPQLKEANLSAKKFEKCYIQVLCILIALVRKCRLVHADLSEYNILYFKGKCHVVDLGQAVLMDHPNAQKLLEMDCTNITKFFQSRSVQKVVPCEELVQYLFDLTLPSAQQEQEAEEPFDFISVGIELDDWMKEHQNHLAQLLLMRK